MSARTGEGIEELQRLISSAIPRPDHNMELLVPYVHGEVVSRLHAQDAEILRTEHTPEGTRLRVRVREELVGELEPYRVAEPGSPAAAPTAEDPAGA